MASSRTDLSDANLGNANLIKTCMHRGIYRGILCLLLGLSCSAAQAEERLQMDGTAIIGNKELPKVLYIVPWKASEPIALSTPPFASVLDENFKPVDRSSFKRRVKYYNELYITSDQKP